MHHNTLVVYQLVEGYVTVTTRNHTGHQGTYHVGIESALVVVTVTVGFVIAVGLLTERHHDPDPPLGGSLAPIQSSITDKRMVIKDLVEVEATQQPTSNLSILRFDSPLGHAKQRPW